MKLKTEIKLDWVIENGNENDNLIETESNMIIN